MIGRARIMNAWFADHEFFLKQYIKEVKPDPTVLIGSVNRGQWRKNYFALTGGQVWLNADGRRKAIHIYENRKQEKWKHPVLKYSLSYARTIELEARLLEKEWTGESGLFAELRLR